MMFSWCCYYRLLSVPEKLRIELKEKLGLLIKIKTHKKIFCLFIDSFLLLAQRQS